MPGSVSSAADSALLDISGLSVGFPTDRGPFVAVRRVDLRIAQGETVAVVGESGPGKSVTALATTRLIDHAGAGRPGVLSHTTSGFAFRAIRLNGRDCAEATLYGAYAGSLGVPVILLSGDDVTASELGPLFAGAAVVPVKCALGHRAARALSPAASRDAIRRGAAAAVCAAPSVAPFTIPGPYRLEIDLTTPALADLAATIPVAERAGPVAVAFSAATMADVIGWVNTLSALSAFADKGISAWIRISSSPSMAAPGRSAAPG